MCVSVHVEVGGMVRVFVYVCVCVFTYGLVGWVGCFGFVLS